MVPTKITKSIEARRLVVAGLFIEQPGVTQRQIEKQIGVGQGIVSADISSAGGMFGFLKKHSSGVPEEQLIEIARRYNARPQIRGSRLFIERRMQLKESRRQRLAAIPLPVLPKYPIQKHRPLAAHECQWMLCGHPLVYCEQHVHAREPYCRVHTALARERETARFRIYEEIELEFALAG